MALLQVSSDTTRHSYSHNKNVFLEKNNSDSNFCFDFDFISHFLNSKNYISLSTNEILYRAGDRYLGCYFVESGLLQSVFLSPKGDHFTTSLFSSGNLIGIASLHDKSAHINSIIAINDCKILFLSHEFIISNINNNPKFLNFLIAELIKQVKETSESLLSLRFMTADQRIARTFLILSRHIGEQSSNCINFKIRLTQSTISEIAGVSRESVCRILSKWSKIGLITQSSNIYRIHDLNSLISQLHLEDFLEFNT